VRSAVGHPAGGRPAVWQSLRRDLRASRSETVALSQHKLFRIMVGHARYAQRQLAAYGRSNVANVSAATRVAESSKLIRTRCPTRT
jgi:hypothetical protein